MFRSWYSDWLRAGRSRDQIPVGARFSAPVQTGPGANPASCTMSTGSFPVVKRGRGVTLTPHPLLVRWSWKSRAITLLPLISRTACTEPQYLYKGALYLPHPILSWILKYYLSLLCNELNVIIPEINNFTSHNVNIYNRHCTKLAMC
jgi:hypothetical protein